MGKHPQKPPAVARSSWLPGLAVMPWLAVAGIALAAPRAAPVAVAGAVTMPIVREEQVVGSVTSPRSASLSGQVAGMITRIAVDVGDRVDPGQLLVELDSELAAHALDTAQADVERAVADLADARRRLGEGRKLLGDGSFPQSEVESLAAQTAIAAARLGAARADARRQQAVLDRHRITAPFHGVISRRVAEVGEWITPGDAVLELVAIDGLYFDFRVAQELYPRLQPDTTVELRLHALPQQHFDGRIEAIVPVSDPAARTFLLRVVPVGDAHPHLTPGMSARALLKLDAGRSGVVVPRDALLRYPDGRIAVWVLEQDGDATRVQERQVRIGLTFGDRVEVIEGLDAGATVVVEGNEALQDGQAVHVSGG